MKVHRWLPFTAGTTGAAVTMFVVAVPPVPAVSAAPAARAAIAPRPGSDFDGDGRRDIAVAAPAATANAQVGAGAVSIVRGSAGGISGSGIVVLNQESPDVAGGSEPQDAFGTTVAGGDLNGDGYDDLVVSEPGEDLDVTPDAGAAILFRGGSAGLGTPSWLGLPADVRADGDRFGEGLAIGDFNGNGTNDLAVLTVTGLVQPYYDGQTTTALAAGIAPAEAGTGPVLKPGKRGRFTNGNTAKDPDSRAEAGAASAAGGLTRASATDINGDAYSDLAIVYKDTSGLFHLAIIPGTPTGLDYSTLTTIPGGGGRSIATGDVNADGRGDVVVGQPFAADNGSTITGGAVTVYYGQTSGITDTSPRTTLHQGSTGVPGEPEAGDGMGLAIAASDVDHDGYADVLAGLPDEDITTSTTTHADAGSTILLFGDATGLSGTGSVALEQELAQVPGSAEAGDRYGSAVSLVDTNNDGHADPVAGVEGEDAGNGGISYLAGAASMPPTTTGIAMLGNGALALGTASHAGTALTP